MNPKPSTVRFVPLLVLAAMGFGAARLALRWPADDVEQAANTFLATLSPELRARAGLKFEDPARTDWHFVPRSRAGVTLKDLSDAQRSAARDLLRAAFSSRGMLKVEGIMALDAVLRDMEKAAGGDGVSRDPLSYTITIYGTPVHGSPWGWKLEGHHLSLNFTLPMGKEVDAFPSFMGAHPARIPTGPQAGLRLLALEEDLARQLARSLTAEQRKEAVLSGEVPREILTMPGRPLDTAPMVGIEYRALGPEQQPLLLRLIEEYASNLRHELATDEMKRIHDAEIDQVRFAWVGEQEPGRPHYYRISGPTFIIEYDNTQNNADHVHTVWHDRKRDFSRDALKEHYEKGHPHPHK